MSEFVERPVYAIVGYACNVYICNGCGAREIGGPPEHDAVVSSFLDSHNLSHQHHQWEQGEVRRRCTHNEYTDIIWVGVNAYWRRCKVCWQYLHPTDAQGNPVTDLDP